ncbi:MAG: hypothetical protein V1787_03020 [Candidatus Micrarchaeota archaeon]
MARDGGMWPQIGAWSYIAGLVIAILAAFTGVSSNTTFLLAGLGLLVGLLNIADKEVMLFLVASLVFLVSASSLNVVMMAIPAIGGFIPAILSNIVTFVAPGAAVVALKALYDVSRSN